MAENEEKPPQKRIEYVPPSNEVIDEFAKNVCEAMAKEKGDDSFNSFEVRSGFAQFIKVIAKIQAKRLTEAANQESKE